ncbi:MAG: twin-arginine translocase subunit TatC [Akkermansia sp.]|nr:twin-arginine translocase subunit TatC [Akkermansia sp.]
MFLLKQLFRVRESLQHPADQAMGEMGFLDHLEELRVTLIRMVLTVLAAMVVCFCFTEEIMVVLRQPAEKVWEQHEKKHLPPGIDAQHWLQAKEAARIRNSLSPQQYEALNKHLPEQIIDLAHTVPLLQAAALLPEEQQLPFLEGAAATPQQKTLLLQLHNCGAELAPAEDRRTLRIMGAFQPGEAFMLSLQMAFFGGLVLSFPLLMYFLMSFVAPGLHVHEKKLLFKCIIGGFVLFIGGCAFAYYGVLPRVLSFFYHYSLGMGIENDWRIGYYLSFAIKLIFVFGVIFELPVIIIPLIHLGLLPYKRMKKWRGGALVACFATALILSPAPDPATMFLMALPMYALYELCVLFAFISARNNKSDVEVSC